MPEFFTLTSIDEARARWFEAAPPRIDVETVETRDALGRVTAETLFSPEPLPAGRSRPALTRW